MMAQEADGREACLDRLPVGDDDRSGSLFGYEVGKKIKGRKRHILTNTDGNFVHAVVHAADIQDRDGLPLTLGEIVKRFPWLYPVFADGSYADNKFKGACARPESGPSKSSNGPITRSASRSCHDAGSLNERSPS